MLRRDQRERTLSEDTKRIARVATKVLSALTLTGAIAACAHDNGSSGTAVITSGTPDGARVTNVRPQDERPLSELTNELCSREAACNHVGDGARWRTEEACMLELGSRSRAQVAQWSCSPRATDTDFETCLAAIRSERCATDLSRVDRLAACQNQAVCGGR